MYDVHVIERWKGCCIMIYVFKTDGTYLEFEDMDDKGVMDVLRDMSLNELKKTEIAFFWNRYEGGPVKFCLYPDGRYEDITYTGEVGLDCNARVIHMPSASVITGEQYDLTGMRVKSYSTNEVGIVKERILTRRGVQYAVMKRGGKLFETYDADLEIRCRKPKIKGEKKRKSELER